MLAALLRLRFQAAVLVLLALAGGLEHDEVPVLGEEIRRLEKFVPGCLEDVICFQE